MTVDREKVIKGLEVCASIAEGESCPKDCPYYQEVCYGYDQLMRDALSLLKEQEEQIDRLIEESASNAEMAEGMKELLKEQKTVVRCKDCINSGTSRCPCHYSGDPYIDWDPDDDWYCADGEAKE